MFKGVKRSYVLLILFLIEVIQELGTNRGLEMLHAAIEKQAEVIHAELLRKIPEDIGALEIGDLVYRAFLEDAGSKVLVHDRTDTSITYRVERCPFHEAFLDVGIDCGYFLGGLCTHLTLPSIQAILDRFDERLRTDSILVRETAEEFCLEKVYLDIA